MWGGPRPSRGGESAGFAWDAGFARWLYAHPVHSVGELGAALYFDTIRWAYTLEMCVEAAAMPVCEWGAFAEGSDGSDGEGAEEAGLLGVASEGW